MIIKQGVLNAECLYTTIIILIVRYIYLESGLHNNLYKQTNGLYNGYVGFFILLYLLHVPFWMIMLVLLGRHIYRSIVREEETYYVLNLKTNIVFGVGVYIALMCIQ